MPYRLAPFLPLAPLAAALIAAPAAASQPVEDDAVAVAGTAQAPLRELTTDRPDVTESPFTVDRGHLQIETTLIGYTRTSAESVGVASDVYEFATTNLRVGVADNLEVNLVWQPFGIADPRSAGGITARGIGSVTLRAKVNLWGNDGPAQSGDTALALLPYVTLPTDGDNGIGESETGFGLIVPLAIDLGGGFGLGVNGAVNFAREDGGAPYDAAGLTSASIAWEWTEALGSYAEVVWEFSRAGEGDIVTLDTGVTLGLGANWQLDAGVNIGTSAAADPVTAFLGVSARF